MLTPGSKAPDFGGSIGGGEAVRLSELLRQGSVVLVFYPADDTSVCTAQLCALRDSFADLEALHCTVLGINPAGEQKHARFAGKYHFPFHLVSDIGGAIARRYGCSGLFGFNKRTVYIIAQDGSVLFAERGNPPVSKMLDALKAAK